MYPQSCVCADRRANVEEQGFMNWRADPFRCIWYRHLRLKQIFMVLTATAKKTKQKKRVENHYSRSAFRCSFTNDQRGRRCAVVASPL